MNEADPGQFRKTEHLTPCLQNFRLGIDSFYHIAIGDQYLNS
jgi:hypothetical protein